MYSKMDLVNLVAEVKAQAYLLETGQLVDYDDIKPTLVLLSDGELIKELEDVLRKHCEGKDGIVNSVALSAFADGLRFLAEVGRFEIYTDFMRVVVGKFKDGGGVF